jgi:hypothetical protein
MDIFIFPIIFLIWAAISILLLVWAFCSLRTAKTFINFSFGIIQELNQLTRFISWIVVSSYTGRFWWTVFQFFFKVIFIIPITFHGIFWHVYNFGHKHCKQSLYDILMNPVPGEEFEGGLGESDDFNAL